MSYISEAGFLLAVSDFEKSKAFYETVLEQKVMQEDSNMVYYESGVALQGGFAEIIAGGKDFAPRPTGAKIEVKPKSNSCQIGFEVEDLDYWVAKIKATEGIEVLHDVAEYNWGQRAFRFYDYDGHLIELGEDLKIVARRFQTQGFTEEQIASKMDFLPLEHLRQLLDTK